MSTPSPNQPEIYSETHQMIKTRILHQPIPSPPHMKAFETLDPFDARSYLSTTPAASDLDCSSNRVNAYAKMAMTASIVSKLVKMHCTKA